jgi:hypothetical protein
MPVLLDDQDGLTDQLDEKQGRALYYAHTYGVWMLQEQTYALIAMTSPPGRCHLPSRSIMAPIAIPNARALSFSVG